MIDLRGVDLRAASCLVGVDPGLTHTGLALLERTRIGQWRVKRAHVLRGPSCSKPVLPYLFSCARFLAQGVVGYEQLLGGEGVVWAVEDLSMPPGAKAALRMGLVHGTLEAALLGRMVRVAARDVDKILGIEASGDPHETRKSRLVRWAKRNIGESPFRVMPGPERQHAIDALAVAMAVATLEMKE